MMHGLSISPDLDTVTYTLAEAIDPNARLGTRRRDVAGDGGIAALSTAFDPPGSTARRGCWFSLGDQDLATHFYRTARLAEGADLTR